MEHASRFLSAHEPATHGLCKGNELYLPDLGVAVRYSVRIPQDLWKSVSTEQVEAGLAGALSADLSFGDKREFDVHLCDNLAESYRRACRRREELMSLPDHTTETVLNLKFERPRVDHGHKQAAPPVHPTLSLIF